MWRPRSSDIFEAPKGDCHMYVAKYKPQSLLNFFSMMGFSQSNTIVIMVIACDILWIEILWKEIFYKEYWCTNEVHIINMKSIVGFMWYSNSSKTCVEYLGH